MSDNKQMTIQEQKDIVRFELINNIFAALGLCSEWVHMNRVMEGLQYVLENRQLIETILPMSIVTPKKDSNMWEIMETGGESMTLTKHLLGFARRLANYRHFAITNKRKRIRLNRSKTTTETYYRLLTP